MARALLIAVLVAGCAHAPVPRPEAAPHPTVTPLPRPGPEPSEAPPAPSGGDVERILAGSGLEYVTLEHTRRWMIAFAGNHLDRVVVFVVHGEAFTVVLGKLFTVGGGAGVDFYRTLARKNFEHDQIKFSVDEDGGVYASYEVPTRLLDRRELLENIYGLAGAIDVVAPDLMRHALPDGAFEPEEADPDPVPARQRLPPGGPVLEVRRAVPSPVGG